MGGRVRGCRPRVFDSLECRSGGRDDEDSNDDYARLVNALLIPLTREGVTTLMLDNTGHEERNRARGASAKHD